MGARDVEENMNWLGRVAIVLAVLVTYGCYIRGEEVMDFLVDHDEIVKPIIAIFQWVAFGWVASWGGVFLWRSRKW